jgi:hypothetical protein
MTILCGEGFYWLYIPVLGVLWILMSQLIVVLNDTGDEYIGVIAAIALSLLSGLLLIGGMWLE